MRRPDLLVAAASERERDDREPGDVVDAVAAVAVGNDSVRVLRDADVVGECERRCQLQLAASASPGRMRPLS
jgi:hypothetical protein